MHCSGQAWLSRAQTPPCTGANFRPLQATACSTPKTSQTSTSQAQSWSFYRHATPAAAISNSAREVQAVVARLECEVEVRISQYDWRTAFRSIRRLLPSQLTGRTQVAQMVSVDQLTAVVEWK